MALMPFLVTGLTRELRSKTLPTRQLGFDLNFTRRYFGASPTLPKGNTIFGNVGDESRSRHNTNNIDAYNGFNSDDSAGSTNKFQVVKVTYSGRILASTHTTSELLKAAGIYARDLFTLNITSRQERQRPSTGGVRRALAAVVTRDDMILLSFGSIRAVANLEQVLLLDAHNPAVRDFARELADAFGAKKASELTGGTSLEDEPYELVFLEMVLRDTVDSFNRRLRLLEPIVDNFLDKVADEIYSDTGVHQLVPLKDCLQSCEIQVKTCLDCLTKLLNDDEEMLSLLLTEQEKASKTGQPVPFLRHEHVELLIGVYARQISNIAMEISFLLGRLQSKQEFVALALAGYRNRMVRMNVHVGIAGLSLAFCTTIAGFFGMNLMNGMEASHTAFLSIIALSGVTSGIIGVSSMNYLSGRKMRARAEQRLDEIDTLTNALSDMCALDYVVKVVEAGYDLNKDQFEKVYTTARQVKNVTHKEVDMLFETFDTVNDGFLRPNDFGNERPHPSIFASSFSEPVGFKVEKIKQDEASPSQAETSDKPLL
jgi:Mg2+ and Co2+ transporter CorA